MLLRHPAAAYAAPFACFILCLALLPKLPLTPRAQLAVWLAAGFGAVLLFSRQVLEFRLRAPAISVAVGAAVFIVWVAPDLLFPALRSHWLFSNALLGSPAASLSPAALGLLRACQRLPFARLRELRVSPALLAEVERSMHHYLTHHLEQDIRTGTFLRRLRRAQRSNVAQDLS